MRLFCISFSLTLTSTLFPYTTLFRSRTIRFKLNGRNAITEIATHETLLEVLRRDFSLFGGRESCGQGLCGCCTAIVEDRKSTRLNSSHTVISYAVFCLKKKNKRSNKA